MNEQIVDIEVDKVELEENIRMDSTDEKMVELMNSVKQHGLLQPIGLFKKANKYIIVWGNRRLQAFKKLGYRTIPSRLVSAEEYKNHLLLNAIENIQREDITPYEFGRICNMLKKSNMNVQEIAVRLGTNLSNVKNCLLIYKRLPENFERKVKHKYKDNRKTKGGIAVNVTSKILQNSYLKRKSDNYIKNVFDLVHQNNLDWYQTELFLNFCKKGMGQGEALKKLSQLKLFSTKRLVLPIDTYEKVFGNKSASAFIQKLIDDHCKDKGLDTFKK